MLKLTEHLLSNPLSSLDELGIVYKRHPQFSSLVHFKYSQINSPGYHPLVIESRGVILDQNNGWKAVALPFFRFFNYGDPGASPINWGTAELATKIDGSLTYLWEYEGTWHVSSSGTPDAGGEVNGFDMTFAGLFWDTFAKQGLELPTESYDNNYTFIFELTSPYNRVVVPYRESRLTLIGIRNRNNGKEISPMWGPRGWPSVKTIPMTGTVEELVESMKKMDAMQQEGYVVVDANFNRIKLKCPQYLALHHMRGDGSPSPKRALEAILAGEHEEALLYFQEWKPLFNEIDKRLVNLSTDLVLEYAEIKDLPTQKEYAAQAVKSKCSGALFALRAGKTKSVLDYLYDMQIDRLADLLQLKDIVVDFKVQV